MTPSETGGMDCQEHGAGHSSGARVLVITYIPVADSVFKDLEYGPGYLVETIWCKGWSVGALTRACWRLKAHSPYYYMYYVSIPLYKPTSVNVSQMVTKWQEASFV